MGIRSRVKKTLQKIRVLAQVIHDESKYPGRPQPHVVAKNPLWGGGDTRDIVQADKENHQELKPSDTSIEQDVDISVHQQDLDKGSLNEEGADYWFLQYDDVEGWNESNPGQKTQDKKVSKRKE